jgi:serine/threonine-protein kinase
MSQPHRPVFSQVCRLCGFQTVDSGPACKCPYDGSALDAVYSDPIIGTVLLEKYRINSLIAQGGFGAVYLGQHILLKRPVAVKVLSRHLCSDDGKVARFRCESKLASSVSHENLVRVYDYGVLPRPFLVMDYIEGPTLASLINQSSVGMPVDLLVELFIPICDALKTLHNAGMIHRDIKGSNIIVTNHAAKQRPVVVDFGLAKHLLDAESTNAKLTQTGETMGSPPYMSPEQFSGCDLDARCDIYSLGCLMYEALAGRKLFDAKTPAEWLAMHLSSTPPSLLDVCPIAPKIKWMDAIIAHCLEKAPDKRYQSMAELKADLLLVKQSKKPKLGATQSKLQLLTIEPVPQSGWRSRKLAAWLAVGVSASVAITVLYENSPSTRLASWRSDFAEGVALLRNHSYQGAQAKLLSAKTVASHFGPANGHLIATLRALVIAYRSDNRVEDSEKLNQQLSVLLSSSPPEQWSVFWQNARMDVGARRYDAAKSALEQALHESLKLGPDNLVEARTLEKLAQVNSLQGNLSSAHDSFERALKIYEEVLPEDDWQIVSTLDQFGQLCCLEHKYKESAEKFGQAISIVKSLYGPRHSRLPELLLKQSAAYRQSGKLELAKADLQDALSICVRNNQEGVAAISASLRSIEEQRLSPGN